MTLQHHYLHPLGVHHVHSLMAKHKAVAVGVSEGGVKGLISYTVSKS